MIAISEILWYLFVLPKEGTRDLVKRANGEGSIRKKPSGRWEGRYTQGIDPVTGRAIQKSVSAKTQAECKEKLAKAIREKPGACPSITRATTP